MTTVRTTAELQAAIASGVATRQIKVVPSASEADIIQARQAATTAERRRCHGIWSLAGKDHRDIAIQAIDNGMSVETLGLELFKARLEEAQRTSAVSTITERWQGEANHSASVSAIADYRRR